jgi:uncharacterized coiled-coil DUF342 family protein
MDSAKPSLLLLQVNRVNRRLLLQTFVNRLVWCWIAALAVGLAWFLLQPLFVTNAPSWLRWAVAGGALGVGAVAAVVWAWLGAPSKLTSALSLDEAFGLKERVTTSLTLTPEQQATPAGQALLEDVQQRLGKLDVGSGFPIRLSWIASLVPAVAALLLLTALFYDPQFSTANAKGYDLKKPPVNGAEIAKTLDRLKRQLPERAELERVKSEKLKEIEAEMERIANRPRDTQEQVRERMKEMAALEEKARDHHRELGEQVRSQKQQLQELNRQADKDNKEGPAKDVQKAMAEGNLDKAKDEMDKLARKIKEGQLSDKEKEQLQKQLDGLKNKADQMAKEQEQKEQRLEKLIKEAKAEGRDAEALNRELDKLRKEGKNMKQLQDLAKKLGDCKECMKKGELGEASERLRAAGEELKKLDLSEKELRELEQQMDKLQDAQEACEKGQKGNKPGEGAGDGNDPLQKGDGQGEINSDKKTPGQQGPVNGRRPKGRDRDYKSFDAKQKSDLDPNKKKYFDGWADGQNYKAKGGAEVAGDIKRASQEAPQSIELQKIPKAAKDMTRGYFDNLRKQVEKEEKPAPKP